MQPKKRTMFDQELLVTSATAKELVGTVREDIKGNKYVYAKAGATALAAGKMTVGAAIDSDVMDQAGTAYGIGSTNLTLTITSTTIAEDYFKGGSLQINDAAGEGHKYDIVSSTAVAADTEISITLEDGLRVAMTTDTKFTLVHSRFMGTVISAVEESVPTGVPLVAVTADYYYWSQVAGDAICLITGTPATGSDLTLGSTAGSLTGVSLTLETTVSLAYQPFVGIMGLTAGVTTDYKPVYLNIM